jgi:hypothetical protein
MKIAAFGILVLGIGLTSCKTRELIYRPVKLIVLDNETKKPLEGIIVTVVNVEFYSKPMITDYISDYVRHMHKYETNQNGIVEIPQFKYNVSRYHFLLSQDIIINLDINDKSIGKKKQAECYDFVQFYFEPDGNFFSRSKSEYKAGVILCYPDNMEWFDQKENTNQYMTIQANGHNTSLMIEEGRTLRPTSFSCDYEEISFYLERFVKP